MDFRKESPIIDVSKEFQFHLTIPIEINDQLYKTRPRFERKRGATACHTYISIRRLTTHQ